MTRLPTYTFSIYESSQRHYAPHQWPAATSFPEHPSSSEFSVKEAWRKLPLVTMFMMIIPKEVVDRFRVVH